MGKTTESPKQKELWQLNVKGNVNHRRILSEAATRAGFTKATGDADITGFVLYLIGSLEGKSGQEIKAFLLTQEEAG